MTSIDLKAWGKQMSSNQDKIIAKYDRTDENIRAISSRSSSLEFHYTKKAMDGFIGGESRVLEVGCGTGYYGMYFADKCGEYVGIDLFPKHIEVFQRKINENGMKNVSCQVGDATKLDGIADDSFDVVCCFGPMYHLPPDERELVFAECRRICKPGGVIAFAYINKAAFKKKDVCSKVTILYFSQQQNSGGILWII